MRKIALVVPLLAALALLLPGGAAAAEETAPADAEAVIRSFLEENHIPENSAAVAYYDPADGEEALYNGQSRFLGASLYKVPLCMHLAAQIAAGALDPETHVNGWPVSFHMEQALEVSSNDSARALLDYLGGLRQAMAVFAPLLGVSESEAADWHYWYEFSITAEQMMGCMKTLYEDPDAYPGVMDHLLRATPGRFFGFSEDRWPIAQKYGFLDGQLPALNGAAVVYADRPFLLVLLSQNNCLSQREMSGLLSRLGEYTLSKGPVPTPTPEPTPVSTPTATPTPAPTAAPTPEPTPTATPEPASAGPSAGRARWLLPVLALAGLGGILWKSKNRKKYV